MEITLSLHIVRSLDRHVNARLLVERLWETVLVVIIVRRNGAKRRVHVHHSAEYHIRIDRYSSVNLSSATHGFQRLTIRIVRSTHYALSHSSV